MNKKKQDDEGLKFAPLRPLDDFILQSARFQIPDLMNYDKWGNRVISNLIYYQTNYFLLTLMLFMVVALFHPTEFFCGSSVVAGLIYGAKVALNRMELKGKVNSFALIAAVLISLFVIFKFFVSLMVLTFGFVLPLNVVFIHASLRLRSLKNKLVNKMEEVGLQRTPMSILLQELGLEESSN